MLIAALTFVLIGGGVALSPRTSDAWAAPGECGTYFLPHNMYYKSPNRGSVHGVTAAVTVRSSGLCNGGGDNFANSYDMLYCGELGSCDFDGWAQVGYEKDLINPMHPQDDNITVTFAQWWNHSAHDTIYGTRHLTAGETYHYKTVYSINGCRDQNNQPVSCIKMYVDSTMVLATDFDPNVYWPSIGFEFAQEAGFVETDVPGLSTSPVAFSGMQYLTATGTWKPTDNDLLVYTNSSQGTTNPTRWGHRPVTEDHKDLFTANP